LDSSCGLHTYINLKLRVQTLTAENLQLPATPTGLFIPLDLMTRDVIVGGVWFTKWLIVGVNWALDELPNAVYHYES